FTIDLANHNLYYVDSDPTAGSNAIYFVDYTTGPNAAFATLLTDPTQFPAGPSDPNYKGTIVAVAPDSAHNIFYFLTAASALPSGQNALWYIDLNAVDPQT